MTATATWRDVRELRPSPHVLRLKEQADTRRAKLGGRVWTEPEHARALARAIARGYRAMEGHPAILRRAAALTEFARGFPITVKAAEPLVGSQTFGPFAGPGWDQDDRDELLALGWRMTAAHIVHDYEGMLVRGVAGYWRLIEDRLTAASPEEKTNLGAFSEALEAFSTFIVRHADAADRAGHDAAADLRRLATDPPETFREALQMVWFVQVFLHAENPGVAISFGRIDQYLWPFLKQDLEARRTDLQAAFDLVCAFFVKCCEGEESQNAVLGGIDAAGRDASNLVSLLFLQAMRRMRTRQPSFCVRMREGASEDFVTAACELAAEGTGHPGFMNDPVVTAALEAAGIAPDRARDWAVVGCYEAVPQGDCYPNTVFTCLHLVRILYGYVQSQEAARVNTYEAFEAGWWTHLQGEWEAMLPGLQERWYDLRDTAPSPFGSVVMGGCIDRARPLEAGVANWNLVGVDILGLGTLVDSLLAVRDVVFEQGETSVPELAACLSNDFPDEAFRARMLRRDGRYGSDSPESNRLARDASERLARVVLGSKLHGGVQPYPGLFAFGNDIHNVGEASPDGRCAHDLISYGVGPSCAVSTTPTSILRSAAHVRHDLCACGNPLALTLNSSDLKREDAPELIRQLVETYFDMGGFHVHFNVTSPEQLRRAQSDPVAHADLMVRVSGFSAPFVLMDERWQDALIERAEQGI